MTFSHKITEVFFEKFSHLLEKISIYKTDTIISGGFSILINKVSNGVAQGPIDLPHSFGFVQYITKPIHTCCHTLDPTIIVPGNVPNNIDVNPPNIFSNYGLITCYFTIALPPPVAKLCKVVRHLKCKCIIFLQRDYICSIYILKVSDQLHCQPFLAVIESMQSGWSLP